MELGRFVECGANKRSFLAELRKEKEEPKGFGSSSLS